MRPWQLASRNPAALPYPTQLLTIWNNGQSNAESQAPAGTPGVPGTMAPLLLPEAGPPLYLWSDQTDAFVSASDGGGNFRAVKAPSGTLGPCGGMILTRVMRLVANASGRPVYGVSHARSSHEIAYFAEDSVQLSQYGDNSTHPTLNNYQHMRQAVQLSGRRVGLQLFWQGESDSGDSQATYYAKAAALSSAWWRDYKAPQIWIRPWVGTGVRAAQDQLAAERDYVYTLNNDDMIGNGTYQADGLHCTAPGYAKVADRIVAMLAREPLPSL